MKKAITKVTACSLIAALAITAFPVSDVHASSVLPAAGGALATGVGSSIKDIQAEKARSFAKQTAVEIHSKISAAAGSSASATSQSPAKVLTPAAKAVEDSANSTLEAEIATSAVIKVSNNEKAAEEGAVKITTASSAVIDEAVANGETEAATINRGSVSDNEADGGQAVVSASESSAEESPEISIRPAATENLAEGEQDLSRTVIARVDGYVNVRDAASEEGEVVGKLYNNSAGEWLGKEGDWYKISSGSVVGYVKGEYVVTGESAVKLAAEVGQRTATVTTTTLKVRADSSAEAEVLGLVPIEDKLSVLEETAEWVKVSIEEGDGWVSKEYVTLTTDFPKAESKAEEEARLKKEEAARKAANAAASKAARKNSSSSGGAVYSASGSGLGSQVANYGLQFVGNPYVYGGTSLTNGTDCSGFTMGVYRNFGVSLPHSSGAQRSCGYAVGSLAEAQPGDLICYSGHVAIYIGNGQIVHASTAKTGIKVSNASYRSILAIRRIF